MRYRLKTAAVTITLIFAACGSHMQSVNHGTRISESAFSLGQSAPSSGRAALVDAQVSRESLRARVETVTVKAAAPTAKPGTSDSNEAELLATGFGSSAAGYGIGSAGFIYAGQALIGMGIVLLPLALYGIGEELERSAVVNAVEQYKFPVKLESRLTETLIGDRPTRYAGRPDDGLVVEIEIREYGFAGTGLTAPCFKFEAGLIVLASDTAVYQDKIIWNRGWRNTDLPPVRCADVDDLSSNSGAMVFAHFDEAIEIISAVVVRRLSGPKS